MNKRWTLKEAEERFVSSISQYLKVSPLLARLLVLRGYKEPEEAGRFLSASLRTDLPSPFLMAGMERATDRLVQALKNKELTCVWGDYDVDGTTGTAALVSFLREIGGDPIYYVPHRVEEGYGLNVEGLRRLSSRGVRLVVSVDCGVSNFQEVELARALGVDVIIVDHHEPPPELPRAIAVLNPHRSDCPFPDKGLSGAGLAFYLIIGLRAKLREMGWFNSAGTPDIRRFLDIIALGTIADMVPLKGTNRVLARRGLSVLGVSERPGVIALKQVSGIGAGEVDAWQVAFQLGPRINAAGRIDAGLKVVEMLTAASADEALRIARELDGNNRERQDMEARVLEEALRELASDTALASRCSIVLGREGWHPGILGIVASRIVERFHRPTVVIGFHQGAGKGSARSIRGFHMVEGLRLCAELLEKFGGHEYAGGLSIRQENFPLFSARFEEVARSRLSSEDLIPTLDIDAELGFSAIGLSLSREIAILKPFGIGNPEPLFMTRGVEISERRDIPGGLRLRLRQGGRSVDAVAFGQQFKVSSSESSGEISSKPDTLNSILAPRNKLDLVYRLTESEWNGTFAVELRIADARPS